MDTDTHKHQCARCGCVWSHSKEKVQRLERADRDKCHNCPECGLYSFGVRSDTDEYPDYPEYYGELSE